MFSFLSSFCNNKRWLWSCYNVQSSLVFVCLYLELHTKSKCTVCLVCPVNALKGKLNRSRSVSIFFHVVFAEMASHLLNSHKLRDSNGFCAFFWVTWNQWFRNLSVSHLPNRALKLEFLIIVHPSASPNVEGTFWSVGYPQQEKIHSWADSLNYYSETPLLSGQWPRAHRSNR